MITRLVHMKFTPEGKDKFLDLFEVVKAKVRSQEGCHHLSLLQDVHNPLQITTYSIWKSEEFLNQYRHTDFFADTWSKTKALFEERASAQSYEVIDKLD